ncbi:MAG: Era-like GTP-binding protein [Methanophagales archaeon]|nr:Era-like GTP-binding protein [Methanophagales archaeon]MCW3141267.1 Era-like GTP-binding protein [Methanophagales archaeon]
MEKEMKSKRRRKGILSRLIDALFFRKKTAKIGIYGPPNAGKTTLANRIIHTFVDENEDIGVSTEIPHETRRAVRRGGIIIDLKSKSVQNQNPTPHSKTEERKSKAKLKLDVVDTPGLATKIDFHEFMAYGLEEEEAKKRAKEATEGVIEAIKWLDDIDGIVLLMDATKDPYTQTNIVIVGNMEARGTPVIIAANKVDLADAAPQRIINAFPQHPVIPISALKGENMEELYEEMARRFR